MRPTTINPGAPRRRTHVQTPPATTLIAIMPIDLKDRRYLEANLSADDAVKSPHSRLPAGIPDKEVAPQFALTRASVVRKMNRL